MHTYVRMGNLYLIISKPRHTQSSAQSQINSYLGEIFLLQKQTCFLWEYPGFRWSKFLNEPNNMVVSELTYPLVAIIIIIEYFQLAIDSFVVAVTHLLIPHMIAL